MQSKLSIGDLKALLERTKRVDSMISSLPSYSIYSKEVTKYNNNSQAYYEYAKALEQFGVDLGNAIHWLEKAISEKERNLN